MIRLLTADRKSITLIETKKIEAEKFSPNWYSSFYKCLTNIRIIQLKKTVTVEEITAYLQANLQLHIYTIIDHQPMLSAVDEELIQSDQVTRSRLADRQRIKINGEDYIDEFGRYVYITSRIGTSADVDLRYEDVPEPELFDLEHIKNGRKDSTTR